MNPKIKNLTAAALGAGLLGLCLRLLLYRVGFDEKNILSSSHPLHLACLILCALLAVYLLWEIRRLSSGTDPAAVCSESSLLAVSIFAAGCLTAVHGVVLARDVHSPLAAVRTALALGSAVSMVLCVLLPGRFRNVHSFCHGLICVFFAVDMLCRYPDWSGSPKLPDYVFQVFTCALLAATSYHRLALDVGLGKRRSLLFFSLMGLFLCLLCAAGPDTRPFYLGGACWTWACIQSSEQPMKYEQEETP